MADVGPPIGAPTMAVGHLQGREPGWPSCERVGPRHSVGSSAGSIISAVRSGSRPSRRKDGSGAGTGFTIAALSAILAYAVSAGYCGASDRDRSAPELAGTDRTTPNGYEQVIQKMIDGLSPNGGLVQLPPGVLETRRPIVLRPGVHLRGHGRGASDHGGAGTVIENDSSDMFSLDPSDHGLSAVVVESLAVRAGKHAGHIFNFQGAAVSRSEFRDILLVQGNPAKSVLTADPHAGFFGNWLHDFEFTYATANTVPAIDLASETINHVAIERFRATGPPNESHAYAIRIESLNPAAPALNNLIRQGTFETPTGGAIELLSVSGTIVEQVGIYDLDRSPGDAIVKIGASRRGGYPSKGNIITGLFSTAGTETHQDLAIIGGNTGGDCCLLLTASTINWLLINGVDKSTISANACSINHTVINNRVPGDVR